MSASESFARSSAFAIANTGPSPIRRGESPAKAKARMRPSGGAGQARAVASSATRSATAPSVTWQELPTVTVPFLRSKYGLSLASASSVCPSRGPTSSRTISCLGAGKSGTISSRSRSRAAIAR